MPRPIRNSILGRQKANARVSAGLMYRDPAAAITVAGHPVPPPTAAPRSERMHFPKGYRPPPLPMSPGYPEPSPYAAVALPSGLPDKSRRPIDWSGRLASRTAYTDWLQASEREMQT